MNEIWSGGGSGPSASARLNAGHPGSLFNRVTDRFKSASAAGAYRDIDNAFSAGGSNGNGSPQSTGSIVNRYGGVVSTPTPVKKSVHKRTGSSGGSSVVSSAGSSYASAKKALDYYEAPLAEKYKFGKETAYQEALANTAFRREMNDLKKAGINPSVYYGAHSSSGAEAKIYPRDASSGGSGSYGGSGGSGRRYGGRRSNNYVFSGGAYYGLMTAAAVIGSVATKSLGVGMAAAGIAGTALKAINGFFKK